MKLALSPQTTVGQERLFAFAGLWMRDPTEKRVTGSRVSPLPHNQMNSLALFIPKCLQSCMSATMTSGWHRMRNRRPSTCYSPSRLRKRRDTQFLNFKNKHPNG